VAPPPPPPRPAPFSPWAHHLAATLSASSVASLWVRSAPADAAAAKESNTLRRRKQGGRWEALQWALRKEGGSARGGAPTSS